ncbi:MAG: hypothetical protein N2255_04660, partial [Kiritimatiellae bacterium]|nr:hypothetical protein [Kiritimatiellia bacterium]
MKRKRLEGTVFCMLLFACLCSGAGEEKKPENYTFREQSLYVPYDKLWQIFEKEGRGVFLPYEKFMELWKTAESKIPRPPQIEPPVPNLVTEMSAEALVSKDVVTVTSDVTIELLKKGWHEIGLGLADAAITSASIGDTAARLTRADNGEYKLLVEKTGDAPETVKLRIQFARAFTKSPGRNSVNFKPPPAPVSRWVIRIPEPDVKVDVQPFLAATEVPDSAAPGETRVLAFIGVTPTMSIEWTPKAEGAKGLQALANATVEQQIVIEEGLTHTKAKLSYDITRTEISQLELEVPLEERIINVYDPNVREWTVRQGATQLITVQLFQPAKGTQNLLIELERVSPPNPLVLPFVNAVNVARQQGIIVIRVAPGLRAEAIGREGLIQMDIGDLPQPLREQRWNFAYRYAAIPYNLRLNVEKLEPRILTDSLLAVHLRPEEMTVRLVTVFDVQKAGVFQLQLDLPEEFEPRNVKGVGASGIEPAEVDRFFVDKTAGNRLLINLARKAQGKIGIALEFVRTLNEPDLLSPSGKSVLLNVPIPKTRGTTFVEREQGRVLVYAPESLLINPL